ncbi:MAG: methyltransferase domain-containing protein [Nitriliruptorales bacterium]|nr:methyltransferase domain-containing protein [Nitriliruptorales bacterium]
MALDRTLYDWIGGTYSVGRRTDPRIAARIWDALGNAETVLNVGAGTGSYEPPGRDVVAVEPSTVMRSQRPTDAAPCVGAVAEHLPFADKSFDVAMAVLTDHHWSDPIRGFQEMKRVARRVVVFQWDERWLARYWLVRDYVPEFARVGGRPSLAQRAAVIGARLETVPIPWNCVDGFFHAYWRRPEAYLDEQVRRCTSVWGRLGRNLEARAVAALAADLVTFVWHDRNSDLLELSEIDLGARLLVGES